MFVINNRFGILLAEKRIKEKRRIAISEVAKETGISRQSLQAWENNTVTRFDVPVMDALCAYFGCGPGDLFEYVSPSGESSRSFGKVYSQLKRTVEEELPDSDVDLVITKEI